MIMVRGKRLKKNELEKIAVGEIVNYSKVYSGHNDWEVYSDGVYNYIVRMCPQGNYYNVMTKYKK